MIQGIARIGAGERETLSEIRYLPVITNPDKILCVGINYKAHREETGREATSHPTIFVRFAGAQIGHEQPMIKPTESDRLDYEGEIAVVLGKRGVDLKPTQLKDYVWGVTILADWSIRAPREPSGGSLNFAFPKNFDGSTSMGPCIAVGETDPTNTDIETIVNGERRQRFNTRDMVFTFGEYLEYLSRDFTLYPGDIISGGTAAGTAADSSALLPDKTSAPERFLKPGDVVEMKTPAIGTLRTRVVAKKK